MANVTATSFFPAKPLGCYGDGGALFTDDKKIYEIAVSCHVHGMGKTRYEYERIGMNARMSTIQAAILLEKLEIFPIELIQRQNAANLYHDSLSKLNLDISLPSLHPKATSSWAQYTIILPKKINREKLQKDLLSKKIPTAIYYPIPINEHEPYKMYPLANDNLPITKLMSKTVLSLPMHPYLSKEDINFIVKSLNDCFDNN